VKKKALLLSLLLHLAPLSALTVLFVIFETRKDAEPQAVAEAPIGDVFVTAQPEESQASAPEPGAVGEPEPARAVPIASNAGIPEGEAEPIGRIEPTYPPLSRRLGEEGESVFMLTISASGRVSQAVLEKSSGSSRLDEAAEAALLAARFRMPANLTSAPVRKRIRVEFRLQSSSR